MAVKRKTKDVELLYQRAEKHLNLREWQRAEKALRDALKVHQNLGGWGLLAWVLVEEGNSSQALAAAKKMRTLALRQHSKPLISLASCLLGYIHHCSGKKGWAERYYRESIEARPRAMTYVFLGNLLYSQGQETEAKVCYRQAVRLDPNFPEARYHLALWYFEHRDYHRTVEQLYLLQERNPEYWRTYPLIASALWTFGSRGFNEAKELLSGIVERLSDCPEVLFALAQTLRLLKQHKDAHQRLTILAENFPGDYRWQIALGEFFAVDTGNLREAETCYKKALELAPESGIVQYYYGRFLAKRGKIKEAAKLLHKARQSGINRAEELLGRIS